MKKTKLPPRCAVGQYGLVVLLDNLQWAKGEGWKCMRAYLGFYDDDDSGPIVYWGEPLTVERANLADGMGGRMQRQHLFAYSDIEEFLKAWDIRVQVTPELLRWIGKNGVEESNPLRELGNEAARLGLSVSRLLQPKADTTMDAQ